ncbi:MAG: TolC family protein [Gammaproteobacteria bacterium]|nr:TolC family protein [Gammaproteobacteria bacterium]
MKTLSRTQLALLLQIITSAALIEQLTLTNAFAATAQQKEPPTLSLKRFIQQASLNDITFESILIDQLPLQYKRDTLLPDSDIFMDVKYQHNFYLDQDRDKPEASLSLSKLFPYNGTELSLSYARSSSVSSNAEDAGLSFSISQAIANNAFGKATRMLDKIIGLENDISRYQIVEAYEDYLASLTLAYYNWYSAYENLRVGQSSLRSSQKLMDNILERQRQNIALPIDVNKMKLLLIGKQENIIVLEQVYHTYANLIFKAIGHQGAAAYVPVKPAAPTAEIAFDNEYQAFTQGSRTYRMLNMLQQQGKLAVEKAADELLPSTRLLLGYTLQGQDWALQDQQDNLYAAFNFSLPIGNRISKAKKQLAEIELRKTRLANTNKYKELQINLKNLFLQIQHQQQLIAVSNKKIKLAEDILEDEAENYSFGKVTLNDYIAAVNNLDENRFSHTAHSVQLNKLLIEWLRLTDQLVSENVLSSTQKP